MRYTFKQFQTEYPDDATCLDTVMNMRYGGKEFRCPSCDMPSKFHRIAKRRAYACQNCGHHIYPCVGTPFEKSRTPLTDWFLAMYLMTSTRHGVAAKELERQIGCTYKTAWRMAHEIRKLMDKAGGSGPMSGHVEADETMIGGKRKGGKRGRGAPGKTVVFGILERGGEVMTRIVQNVRRATLEPHILEAVTHGSRISTDELGSYRTLTRHGYRHETVNHSIDEWARGDVHVNSLEGYWSQLKRSIRGTHVHVSAKHLPKYLGEFGYRYNMRKLPHLMFSRLLSCL